LIVFPDEGAKLTLAVSKVTSPGARPRAIKGVPVGLGDGLPLGGGAATGIKLAPVKSEIVAVDSVVTAGDNK
jgi:hypothetical protein